MTYSELTRKGRLLCYYLAEGNRLIKINVTKEKNKEIIKKVVSEFEEDIKINYMPLEGFEHPRITAIVKNSNRIDSPSLKNRIELVGKDAFKGFTIKSDLISNWSNKL